MISDDDFQAMFDEAFGTVEICGQVFDAGYAFRKTDPVAFRMAKSLAESALERDE